MLSFGEGAILNPSNAALKTIGIIGGGKRGSQLFQLFLQSSFVKVAFVSDNNPLAPALAAARKAGVATFSDFNEALNVPVDFIFEVTGQADVVQKLSAKINSSTCRLITHDMTAIILQVIDENDQKARQASITEIKQIKTEIDGHLERLDRFVEDIGSVVSEMNMLSINARIEAARVGVNGKGFEVVASEMGKSSASVEKITKEIELITQAIVKTSGQIDDSLKRLMDAGLSGG
jgi:methyl-accepting chemotaxis protein